MYVYLSSFHWRLWLLFRTWIYDLLASDPRQDSELGVCWGRATRKERKMKGKCGGRSWMLSTRFSLTAYTYSSYAVSAVSSNLSRLKTRLKTTRLAEAISDGAVYYRYFTDISGGYADSEKCHGLPKLVCAGGTRCFGFPTITLFSVMVEIQNLRNPRAFSVGILVMA